MQAKKLYSFFIILLKSCAILQLFDNSSRLQHPMRFILYSFKGLLLIYLITILFTGSYYSIFLSTLNYADKLLLMQSGLIYVWSTILIVYFSIVWKKYKETSFTISDKRVNPKYSVYFIACIILGYFIILIQVGYKIYFVFWGFNGGCFNKDQLQVLWENHFNETKLLLCIVGYASPLETFIHLTNFTIPCFLGLFWLLECLKFKSFYDELETAKDESCQSGFIAKMRCKYLKLIHQVEDMNDTWGIMMAINLFFQVIVLCLAGFVSIKINYIARHLVILLMIMYTLSFSAFMIGPILLYEQVSSLSFLSLKRGMLIKTSDAFNYQFVSRN